jgi:elongation of very long chain fatty acids protein 6
MELYQSFVDYEQQFKGIDAIDYTRNHAEIPLFAIGCYLLFIFYFPKMQEWGMIPNARLPLKRVFAVWNLSLSLFSIMGASRVVPYLVRELTNADNGTTFMDRFVFSVCGNSMTRYVDGPVGLWTFLFIYSKFPELLDTVFLVVQKKKVIFLHWFHHTTVLMYCWHAYHNAVSQGIWFAAMNLSVHGIMYAYYFMGAINMRHVVRPFAPVITTIQILQMVGGIAVTVTASFHHDMNEPTACYTDAANWKMGLGMYSVYCGLFVVLFLNLYCTKKSKGKRRGAATPASIKAAKALARKERGVASKVGSPGLLCSTYNPALDVGDAVGFFHGHTQLQEVQEVQEVDDDEEREEMQSPRRKSRSTSKKRGGTMANVCAVEKIDDAPAVRRSMRQRNK